MDQENMDEILQFQNRVIFPPEKLKTYKKKIALQVEGLDDVGLKSQLIQTQAKLECLLEFSTIWAGVVDKKIKKNDADINALIEIINNVTKAATKMDKAFQGLHDRMRDYVLMMKKPAGSA